MVAVARSGPAPKGLKNLAQGFNPGNLKLGDKP
jgi:hypothetical protein